ncbi:hypothetical protein [Litorihabitans aurantiacus]|uniref:Uncharacterized protein n=1 Tax=Litorihabitans aurantiacus TaxID=1930061 RepID=A0AA37XHR0_9MICO|nr:hypothetical protein [Litorihabitans aurantiacus]GMA33154.1 hypothetical protein GCM10025875_31460 [Litorihabitans aurantiacus]
MTPSDHRLPTPAATPTPSNLADDVRALAVAWRAGADAVATRVAELDLALPPAVVFAPLTACDEVAR